MPFPAPAAVAGVWLPLLVPVKAESSPSPGEISPHAGKCHLGRALWADTPADREHWPRLVAAGQIVSADAVGVFELVALARLLTPQR